MPSPNVMDGHPSRMCSIRMKRNPEILTLRDLAQMKTCRTITQQHSILNKKDLRLNQIHKKNVTGVSR